MRSGDPLRAQSRWECRQSLQERLLPPHLQNVRWAERRVTGRLGWPTGPARRKKGGELEGEGAGGCSKLTQLWPLAPQQPGATATTSGATGCTGCTAKLRELGADGDASTPECVRVRESVAGTEEDSVFWTWAEARCQAGRLSEAGQMLLGRGVLPSAPSPPPPPPCSLLVPPFPGH